jgi:Uncharacterized membrane protein, required for colicin V production
MNWFDLITAILLLIALVNGYRKGLIMQLVGLATLVLAAIFGGKLAGTILPELNRLIDLSPEAARVLSYILAFALIAVVLSLIGRLLQRFIDVVFLSFFNRVLGSVVAVGTMMLFLSIILNLVLMLDKNEGVIKRKIKEESFFFERVEAVVPAIVPYLNKALWNEYIPEKYREEIENKSDSIYRSLPGSTPIDSAYQQRYFNVN